MMNPDMKKAAEDKTTLEDLPIPESDKPKTTAASVLSQDESVQSDTEDSTVSTETAESNHPSVQGETSIQEENTDSGPPKNRLNEEEQISLVQPPESSVPKTHMPGTPKPETSLPDATPPADQAVNVTKDTLASSEPVNDEAPSANVATPKADQVQAESRANPSPATAPVKPPYMDITPYLKLMVEKEGSDMYFTCGARVQIKINGVSLSIGNTPLPKGAVNDILPGILNERQMAEFEEEMELDTAFSLDNVGRFRINVLRQRGEVALVIRQIKAQIPSVKELQLPQIIEDLIMEPRGLLIIAGATGTGKSTTVASMIDHRNSRRSGHILTIEDPIEFIHDHKLAIVNQREVGLDTKSFKEALRRAMREAPDVIMIGEIRDAETMQQALSYADTGHLCIATLHGTNTTQCMERIIGLFPEANRSQVYMDLSNNLRAIICQRLLVGTDKSRVPATEVLMNEPMVKKLIQEGSIHKLKEVIEKAPPESPLHSFDNDMLRLFQANKVSMEEALSHADEPDHFKLKINLGGGGISSSADDIYS